MKKLLVFSTSVLALSAAVFIAFATRKIASSGEAAAVGRPMAEPEEPKTAVPAETKKPAKPSSAPYKVVLVVQNHTSDAPSLPMAAFADTLTSRLSGGMFRIVNPHNVIGVNQNRSAQGETMPEASAIALAQKLGADGVITASIQEFTGEDIGVPAVAHKLKVRLALNLADAATGETICGIDGVEFSENYTAEKLKENTATLYEGLMHATAANAADKLLAKAKISGWDPNPVDVARVKFTCNIQGADIKVDGLAMGTAPATIEISKGIHNLRVEYPFCIPYLANANFANGQTYNVVLQLDDEGRKRFRDDATFAEIIDRIRKTGATDDYVRRTLADGTAQFWKNSGVKIDDGEVKDLKLDPPGGTETIAPRSPTVDQLIEKARGL